MKNDQNAKKSQVNETNEKASTEAKPAPKRAGIRIATGVKAGTVTPRERKGI